jgi:hypothetical protein
VSTHWFKRKPKHQKVDRCLCVFANYPPVLKRHFTCWASFTSKYTQGLRTTRHWERKNSIGWMRSHISKKFRFIHVCRSVCYGQSHEFSTTGSWKKWKEWESFFRKLNTKLIIWSRKFCTTLFLTSKTSRNLLSSYKLKSATDRKIQILNFVTR